MIVAAVFVVAAGVLPAAGDAALEGQPTITAVVVEGARDEAARQSAVDVFGMKAGDALDVARVRLGIKRVFLTGPWADVQASVDGGDGGVVLFVRLIPDVLVSEVTLKAARDISGATLPQDRLREAAGIDVGERYRAERIDEAAARVRAAMADLGYPRAEVKTEVTDAGSDARRVRFSVAAGAPVVLRKLVVDGDAKLSRVDIEELLGVVEGRAFDRPRLEVGLERVKALLMRRRYLGTKVSVVRVTHDAARASAEVVVAIDAGPRYRLRYVGNHVLSDAGLRVVLHEGKIEGIDALGIARAKAAVEQAYRVMGYARVKVSVDDAPATRPNDDDAERELRFFIEEGPRAEVTEVHVVGAKARKAGELVEVVWSTVSAETPDPGLLQPADIGDIDDLLSTATGKQRATPRPFEVSDEGLELLPRPLIGRKPVYIESAFVEAGRRIADLYRSDGFLDVVVKGPFADFSDDGKKIAVRYGVDEGPRVTISAVRFVDARECAGEAALSQCAESLSLAELLHQVKLVPGQPASFSSVADARATLEKNLQDRGHPFARVTEGIERLRDKPEVDVVYTVDPGSRVSIGKVRTRGNAVTQDMVILDRVTLKPDDLYSAGEVERSRERLARLGLFSSVSIELLDDDPKAAVRDLLVVVKERPQFAVEVGAGASVEDGPRAFLAGEVRNIFGLGVGLRGRGQLNYPRAFYDFLYDKNDANNPLLRFPLTCPGPACNPVLDYGQFFEGQAVLTGELPKVYGMPFDTRLHVDTAASRQIRPAFTLNRASVLGGFEMQPASWLQVGPQIEGEYSDFDCPKDLNFGVSCGEGNAGQTRRLDAGFLRQTTYRITGSVDLRDNPIHPRSGAWISQSTDLALGSGRLRANGDDTVASDLPSDFLKLTAAAAAYVPLSPTFVWALSGRIGNVFPFQGGGADYIPLFKRFYLGGTNSIRGYREDEILPSDNCGFPATTAAPLRTRFVPGKIGPDGGPLPEAPDDRIENDGVTRDPDCKQGAQSLGGNFMVLFRSEIRVTVIGDLEVGTFVDVGQLLENVQDFAPTGLAAGAGVGLRYNTPVGPFAVDLGWKVIDGRRRLPSLSSIDRMNLHLSIGYF